MGQNAGNKPGTSKGRKTGDIAVGTGTAKSILQYHSNIITGDKIPTEKPPPGILRTLPWGQGMPRRFPSPQSICEGACRQSGQGRAHTTSRAYRHPAETTTLTPRSDPAGSSAQVISHRLLITDLPGSFLNALMVS